MDSSHTLAISRSFPILTINSAAKRGKQFQTLPNITFPITILTYSHDSHAVFTRFTQIFCSKTKTYHLMYKFFQVGNFKLHSFQYLQVFTKLSHKLGLNFCLQSMISHLVRIQFASKLSSRHRIEVLML